MTEKQYPAALEKLKMFETSEKKTSYENFVVSRTKAAIASGMGDNALLAKCFEEMIASEFLPAEEKLRFTEGLAGTFYNLKQYNDSQIWTKRYLAANPNHTVMQDSPSEVIW